MKRTAKKLKRKKRQLQFLEFFKKSNYLNKRGIPERGIFLSKYRPKGGFFVSFRSSGQTGADESSATS